MKLSIMGGCYRKETNELYFVTWEYSALFSMNLTTKKTELLLVLPEIRRGSYRNVNIYGKYIVMAPYYNDQFIFLNLDDKSISMRTLHTGIDLKILRGCIYDGILYYEGNGNVACIFDGEKIENYQIDELSAASIIRSSVIKKNNDICVVFATNDSSYYEYNFRTGRGIRVEIEGVGLPIRAVYQNENKLYFLPSSGSSFFIKYLEKNKLIEVEIGNEINEFCHMHTAEQYTYFINHYYGKIVQLDAETHIKKATFTYSPDAVRMSVTWAEEMDNGLILGLKECDKVYILSNKMNLKQYEISQNIYYSYFEQFLNSRKKLLVEDDNMSNLGNYISYLCKF